MRTDRRLRCRRGHPVRLGLACSLSLPLASYWPSSINLPCRPAPCLLALLRRKAAAFALIYDSRCCSCALCGTVHGCLRCGTASAVGAVSGHASAGRGVRVQRCTSCLSCGTSTATEAGGPAAAGDGGGPAACRRLPTVPMPCSGWLARRRGLISAQQHLQVRTRSAAGAHAAKQQSAR